MEKIIYVITKNGNTITERTINKINDMLFNDDNNITSIYKMGSDLNNPRKLLRKLHNNKSFAVINIITDDNGESTAKFIVGPDNIKLLISNLKQNKKSNSHDIINKTYEELIKNNINL